MNPIPQTSEAATSASAEPIRRVPYVNFPAQYAEEKPLIEACVEAVFSAGDFIGGAEIGRLEEELAAACGTAHAVALNSGTDALSLAMAALGIGRGDEVIVPPNSFVASAATVAEVGATPVFADVGADQNIDPEAVAAAVTPRTRAIMPVHLTGRIADMDPLLEIAARHELAVVEDAAQSMGSRYDDRKSGSLGTVGCFSAHPLKNLNAAGDAGFLVTDRSDIADWVRLARNHGLKDRDTVVRWGRVSRLDTLQAALLRMRLGRLDDVIERRRRNVALYRALLEGLEEVFLPPCRQIEFNTFHTLVAQVERRDALRDHLRAHGVDTAIHYPVPLHLQPAAAELGYRRGDFPVTERQSGRIVSLPVHQFLSTEDIEHVAGCIREFYR